jgi:hypothetical protein
MKWVVDDRGRVALLESHYVNSWASEFDPPERAILELGFICIDERSDHLILALHTSKVRPETLVGTFYFLAHRQNDRITIYSGCGTEHTLSLTPTNITDAYAILEDLVVAARPDAAFLQARLESSAAKQTYVSLPQNSD